MNLLMNNIINHWQISSSCSHCFISHQLMESKESTLSVTIFNKGFLSKQQWYLHVAILFYLVQKFTRHKMPCQFDLFSNTMQKVSISQMTSVEKFHRYPDKGTVDYILQDDCQEQ